MNTKSHRPLLMTLAITAVLTASAAHAQPIGGVEAKLRSWDTEAARRQLEPMYDRTNARHLRAMAEVLMQEGSYGQAMTHLRDATRADADDPANWNALGEALARQNPNAAAAQGSEAMKAFDKARTLAEAELGQNPRDFAATHQLGVALRGLRRYPQAIDKLSQAKRMNPSDAVALYDLGVAEALDQRWADAINTLDAAIRKSPGIAYAYYYRGTAAGKMNRKDLLVLDFDRFLKLAPDAPEAAQARSVLSAARR
ncbi:MAG: tetratricopeptide repeat protein [Thermoanaerobaculia bacterium]|nr:tetratricopeptide repeat protein [Thermoanaerobaculia bacterium]